MGIYRGSGGSTDATRDASSEAAITVTAKDTAVAAATTAQASASAATVQAAAATSSATAAAASAATASGAIATSEASATSATASASAASTSATNASNSATAASTSASNASTSATNAATSATNASNSATAASTSASNASTSATNASNSASTASTAATNAAASYDAFDDRYLGSKTTAPSVDNDGNALLVGAIYYNTTGTPQLFIWNGTAWDAAAFSSSGAVTSFNTRTGSITLSSSDVTSALTFTPYNATNPSGYTSNTGTVTSVGGTAGTGISITGSPITGSGSLTITNTAPDQTVALTAGTGISTSGTYPNFTITNSAPDQTVAITAGTGISATGTYPNFTVTNSAPMTYAGAGIAVSTGSAWTTSLTAPSGAIVGTTDTQTLTNKTITGLKETRVAMGASNIDLALGNYFTRTISGATTLTVSNIPTTGTAQSFILDLTNGGAGAITYFSGVKWAGGTAPALTASGRDVLGFFTHDGGTTWTGLVLGKDVK